MLLTEQSQLKIELTGPVDWRDELTNSVSTVDELKNYISLGSDEEESIRRIVKIHPMNITRYYLSLIDPEDPDDPVRKMAIPREEELVVAGAMGETTGDPYGDDKHDKGNGILHKYPYSVLVVATDYCAMYCRHCFRKRMVGLPNRQTVDNFKKAVEYIRNHKEVTNVIISGGDPLTLPTAILREMLEPLTEIPHVNFVRIGSRTPVVFPQRFDDPELLAFLTSFNKKKALFIPTHFNHSRELTPQAARAVKKIRSTGTVMNNQAVFLRGINDTADELEKLMNGLIRLGINPYYLYQCMPVKRVRSHFQIPLKEGIDIVTAAKKRLDGYAKRFKFIMGHDSGKIEICGRQDDLLIMNRIHARPEDKGTASDIMIRRLTETGGWLEDLAEAGLS